MQARSSNSKSISTIHHNSRSKEKNYIILIEAEKAFDKIYFHIKNLLKFK